MSRCFLGLSVISFQWDVISVDFCLFAFPLLALRSQGWGCESGRILRQSSLTVSRSANVGFKSRGFQSKCLTSAFNCDPDWSGPTRERSSATAVGPGLVWKPHVRLHLLYSCFVYWHPVVLLSPLSLYPSLTAASSCHHFSLPTSPLLFLSPRRLARERSGDDSPLINWASLPHSNALGACFSACLKPDACWLWSAE